MIALILGTSEGNNILQGLNSFTDDILISTATSYGGELLRNFKYKVLNTKPLVKDELMKLFRSNNIELVIDGSHPYAYEITLNCKEVCSELGIGYVRYERPSIIDKYTDNPLIKEVSSYEELKPFLEKLDGNIFNTTGSRNINKILQLGLKNRIIHRVLPSVKVMEDCLEAGVKPEDIIAMKGPISYEMNYAFFKAYEAKAVLLKDSGIKGGTEEKLRAAIDLSIDMFVINRRVIEYNLVFNDEIEVINYVMRYLIN